MKTNRNIGLLIIGFVLAMMAFSACSSESAVPSEMHSQPVHGDSKF